LQNGIMLSIFQLARNTAARRQEERLKDCRPHRRSRAAEINWC
jgi:hypothetical protein